MNYNIYRVDKLESVDVYDKNGQNCNGYSGGYKREKCIYNADGTPFCYRDRYSFYDNGRMSCSFARYFFEYDASGRRTKKIDKYGDTTTFEYIGDRLHKAGALQFHYGANGVIGFYYAGKDYFYEKNLQGDIISIVTTDNYGNRYVAAIYEYDAFGNHKVFSPLVHDNGIVELIENTSSSFIGNINPIRYRGYYFDVETGWYYVDGRYYDPELCRFIEPASTESINPMVIDGLNCYNYAKNKPDVFKYSTSIAGGNSRAETQRLESKNTSFYRNDKFFSTIIGIYEFLGFVSNILGITDAVLEHTGVPDTALSRSNIATFSYVMFIYDIGFEAFNKAYLIYNDPTLTNEQKIASFDAELKYITGKTIVLFLLSANVGRWVSPAGPTASVTAFLATLVISTLIITIFDNAADMIWEYFKEEYIL